MRAGFLMMVRQVPSHAQPIESLDIARISLQRAGIGLGGSRHVARFERDAAPRQQARRRGATRGHSPVKSRQCLRVKSCPFCREAIPLLDCRVAGGLPSGIAQDIQRCGVVAVGRYRLDQAAPGGRGQSGHLVGRNAGGKAERHRKRQPRRHRGRAPHSHAIARKDRNRVTQVRYQ
jgi:hypothetical protein